MKLGLYNAILHDRPLPEAIAAIADVGLTGIEINTGGFLPARTRTAFDDILVSDAARDDYLGIFEGTGVSIAGLNCNGNPLHPNPDIGPKHAEDIRRSIRLAELLGADRVVTMSGLPDGESSATRTNWIVNAWNSAALDVLDYQWAITADFWREIDELARDIDVKVALECTRRTSCSTARRCINSSISQAPPTSAWRLDASHLFWQQMDPVAVVESPRRTGGSTRRPRTSGSIPNTQRLNGVLDNSFPRLPPDEPRTESRRRRMGQRVAEGVRVGLRRARQGSRHRLLDRVPARPGRRSTPTCWSTSSTRTPSWAASRASRWRPSAQGRQLRALPTVG